MLSLLPMEDQRQFSSMEIELFGLYLAMYSKAYLGLINDELTHLVFEKRALLFKSDDVNFL